MLSETKSISDCCRRVGDNADELRLVRRLTREREVIAQHCLFSVYDRGRGIISSYTTIDCPPFLPEKDEKSRRR